MFEDWNREKSSLLKAFFGKPARALLAAWVIQRQGDSFFQQEAVDALRLAGETMSATQGVLEFFVYFGMLQPINDGRRRYYTPVEHPLWSAYQGVAVACGLLPMSVEESQEVH